MMDMVDTQHRQHSKKAGGVPGGNSSSLPGEEKDISQIIVALDFLRIEARKTGEEDIAELIEASFTICRNAYCILRRSELALMLSREDGGCF